MHSQWTEVKHWLLVDKKENLDPVVPEDEVVNDCGEISGRIIRPKCWTLDLPSYFTSLSIPLVREHEY
jgi:hypothetical protein